MSAGSPEDVVRSVQRWTANALGTFNSLNRPWAVERVDEQVPDIQRPYALVGELSPLTPVRYRTTLPQGDVQWNTTLSINAFPETDGTPRDCSVRAAAVLGRLLACVTRGVLFGTDPPTTVTRFSSPFDVPLFDYDGIPATGPNRAGRALPYTGMDVDSMSGRPVADVADDRRYMVVLDLRLSFWAAGAVLDPLEPGSGPVVVDVPGTYVS